MSLAIAEGLKLPEGSRFSIGAVPAAIAGVAPTLDFRPALERREIEAVSLTDKLTFTGGNQGTFVGSDGYIQRAQTNVPRFTHDPVTRQSLGMLVEPSGQNLFLRSEEFNNASWSKSNSSIAANTGTSPDGSTTADRLVGNSTLASHYAQQGISGAVNGVSYVSSVYVEPQEISRIEILHSIGSTIFAQGYDLSNGTLLTRVTSGTTAATGGFIRPAGQGRYRCGIAQVSNGTTGNFRITLRSANTIAFDATNAGVLIWGAQLEEGSSATSYNKTEASTVTRTADSAVLDGTKVITGTYTMVEKPAGCAVISGTNINLQNGFTVERVMIFPATLTAGQITAIRAAM